MTKTRHIQTLDNLSRFYKALADPIRLYILKHLLKEGSCTCIHELSRVLERDQSVIFRHIKVLDEVGIISTKKQQKHLMCCIKNPRKIKRLLEELT